jgi:2-keto-4-pentenoate hydratase/2-oxohepta-3-ene-1,7-dioic acid hydratase in catechol pathway
MKLATMRTENGPIVLVLNGRECSRVPVGSMLELISMGETGLDIANDAFFKAPRMVLDLDSLLAPIPEPRRNIFALGWNYAEHAKEAAEKRELAAKIPERPVIFTKATTTANSPYGEIELDPKVTSQLDWEVELGVVIGKGGKNIPRDKAYDHVFGYFVLDDITGRDVQTAHGQFFKGKSLDGACPMGPWIVTKDEISDPGALQIRCTVNGVLKQDGNTADFIFGVPAIVEWLSLGLTLLPGDLIATGTPSGVGFARKPPEFLKAGDIVECKVEKIGAIRNRIVDAKGL